MAKFFVLAREVYSLHYEVNDSQSVQDICTASVDNQKKKKKQRINNLHNFNSNGLSLTV